MKRTIQIGQPEMTVELRRSPRARRYSLRVSAVDGKISLTMPVGAREKAALDFLHQHERWLRDKLTGQPTPVTPAIGESLPLRGKPHLLVAGTSRAPVIVGGEIHVPQTDKPIGPRLAAFLKLQARNDIAPLCDTLAAQIGRKVSRITLRDTRSRWGSCNERGCLMFSWRLVMAPPEVLHYVVAHEVAHLVEMNHSPAFWRVVEQLDPDFQTWRGWLRANGAQLHRYRLSVPS